VANHASASRAFSFSDPKISGEVVEAPGPRDYIGFAAGRSPMKQIYDVGPIISERQKSIVNQRCISTRAPIVRRPRRQDRRATQRRAAIYQVTPTPVPMSPGFHPSSLQEEPSWPGQVEFPRDEAAEGSRCAKRDRLRFGWW